MRRHQPWLVVVLIGAIIGVVFAAISTYDFVQHLDRQVHNLHCSFIPGVSHGGESGCQVAMMSPYSSVLRATVWGGIPISLPAMSVFAFLAFFALDLMVTRRKDDPRATGLLALATALPAVTSAVMLAISLSKLGTTCKLCVGIYLASAVCLVGGIAVWRGAVGAHRAAAPRAERGVRVRHRDRHHAEPAFIGTATADSSARLVAVGVDTAPSSSGFLVGMFGIGVAFVAIPVVLYLAMAPDHGRFIGTCEGLAHPEDGYGVMVRIERAASSGAPAIEVLDPLCPACRAFEQRLAASGLAGQLDRKAVLFPLDNTCNWMVTEATHPGACTISEAVLCAGATAPDVIAWAFENQDRIRSETRADPAAAARIVKQQFPALASCVGSPEARSRLNKSMRWIVANNIRVLTPQLFIDHVKLCDEDVDLGLEYTLSTMLERHARGTLARPALENGSPAAATAPADPAAADPAAGGSAASDKAASDKPADGAASDRAATDRAATDRAATDKEATDRAATDRAATDKAATDRAATDRAATDRAATDRAATDRAATDKAADKARDKAGRDKATADKATSDKAAPEPAASDKAAPEPAASDKATEKAGSDKPAADKPAADKPAADKPAADKPADTKPPEPASGPVTKPGDAP